MQAQKLQVKFFANAEISETALVPVFHDWIRERVVPDELLQADALGTAQRVAALAPQAAAVLTAVALSAPDQSPSDIARACRMPTNQLTAQLAKLEAAGLVRAVARGDDRRRRHYQVADRLMRIWLAWRERVTPDASLAGVSTSALSGSGGGRPRIGWRDVWAKAKRAFVWVFALSIVFTSLHFKSVPNGMNFSGGGGTARSDRTDGASYEASNEA